MTTILTNTSDINITGMLRYASDKDLVPSVQFTFNTERGTFLFVCVSNHNVHARIYLEMLYLLSKDSIELEYFVDKLNDLADLAKEDLQRVVSYLRTQYFKIIDTSKGSINLSYRLLRRVLNKLSDLGLPLFQINGDTVSETIPVIESLDTVDMDFLIENSDSAFYNYLLKRSYKGDAIFFNNLAFYPEDHLFDREFLTLEDTNKLSGNAFSDYQSLRNLYASREYYKRNSDLYNKTRCSCGAELVIRHKGDRTTLIYCINFFCYEKMGVSISDLASALKVSGIGETIGISAARATSLIKLANTGSSRIDYTNLLDLSEVKGLTSNAYMIWERLVDAVISYNGSLKDLIKVASLPYIGSDAARILTLNVLGDRDLTPVKLLKICNASGKHDKKFVLYLWFYMQSIRNLVFLARESLDLRERQEIPIYITNGVLLQLDNGQTKKMTKDAYITFVNNILTNELDKPHLKVVIQDGVTLKSHFLIADQGTSTSSAEKAYGYGVPIVSSRDFINMLGGYN